MGKAPDDVYSTKEIQEVGEEEFGLMRAGDRVLKRRLNDTTYKLAREFVAVTPGSYETTPLFIEHIDELYTCLEEVASVLRKDGPEKHPQLARVAAAVGNLEDYGNPERVVHALDELFQHNLRITETILKKKWSSNPFKQ